MRKMYKSRNFAGFLGLIEEAQSMGNRMEAKIEQIKDLDQFENDWHRKKNEEKALRKEIAKLEREVRELEKKKAELE